MSHTIHPANQSLQDAKIDPDLASKYKQLTDAEHAREKTFYMGSDKVIPYQIYVMQNGKITKEEVAFSQVFYKMLDELLVNVIDLSTEHKCVKAITVTFDRNTGMVTITNTGKRGIPCGVVSNAAGRKMYLPEMLFTQFRAGSNHKSCKSKTKDSYSTGTNGLGCKLANIKSMRLYLLTHDNDLDIKYEQEFKDQMREIGKPTISKLKRADRNKGTTISFTADWSLFTGWPEVWNDVIHDVMDPIFRARIAFASAFTGIDMTYNGEQDGVTDAFKLASYFIDEPITTTIKPKKTSKKEVHPWKLAFGVQKTTPTTVSIINGACVHSGNHLNHIIKQVVKYCKPKICDLVDGSKSKRKAKDFKSKYRKTMVSNYVSVVLVGMIPNIEFDSQLKTNITCPSDFVERYVVGNRVLKSIWDKLEPIIYDNHMVVSKKKNKRRVLIGRTKDYEPAVWAGRANKETWLFATEGHSAAGLARRCLISPEIKDWSFKNCGIYCLGGVNLNSRREVQIKGTGPTRKVIMSRRMQDSPKYNAMMKILNLDPACDYRNPDDRARVTYRNIVFMTDADADGRGNIFSMWISNFVKLHPGLVEAGVIHLLSTPIQRWYPANKRMPIINFYTEDEARDWLRNNPNSNGKIKYFKGLATNSNADALDIFLDFKALLTTFYMTQYSDLISEYMFGEDTSMRKILHSSKPDMKNEELNERYMDMVYDDNTPLQNAVQMYSRREPIHHTGVEKKKTPEHHHITCTIEYQSENIARSLPHIIDGFVKTQRKCVFAIMRNPQEKKVFQWVGNIADVMYYHHGNQSMEGAIVNLAQDFPGTNNIPPLLPIGQFGSRMRGGKDAGSSRYISTNINPIMHKLFRSEDEYCLTYTLVDGVRVEPNYLCPVVPRVLLENSKYLGHAWVNEAHARRYDMVILAVRQMICGQKPPEMIPGQRVWDAPIINVAGDEWSIGRYEWDEKKNRLTITDLPLGVWNHNYLYDEKTGLTNNEYVEKLEDYSSDYSIRIIAKLKKGAMETIMAKPRKMFHQVITEFKLKKKLNRFLNYIGVNGQVDHYSEYCELLHPWFNERKRLYQMWLNRQAAIVRIRVKYNNNLLRFITGYDKYNVNTGKTMEQADQFLEDHKFQRFNTSLVDNPKFTPVDQMEDIIMRGAGSTFEYIKSAHHPNRRTPAAEVKLRQKIMALNAELEDVTGPDALMLLWSKHVNEFDAAYKKTLKEGWSPILKRTKRVKANVSRGSKSS